MVLGRKRDSNFGVDFFGEIENRSGRGPISKTKPQSVVNNMALVLSRLPRRFTVRFENRPGELASPARILAQRPCICSSEIRRHLSKKFAIQSSPMSSGFDSGLTPGRALYVIASMLCCFFASSAKRGDIARRSSSENSIRETVRIASASA